MSAAPTTPVSPEPLARHSFAASGGSGARSYGTIVADPPWIYGSDAYANNPKPGEVRTKAIRKPLPYPEMTLAQIRSLPVREMAAPDCRLWLWTTNRYLPAAFGVMDAWGFEYRQTIVWHKTGNPSPFGGSVAPNHAEYILVGVRGNPKTRSRLKSNVVAANVLRHSEKPALFLDMVESVSPAPYVELFCREARLGWDRWGNECESNVELVLPNGGS